MRKLIWEKSYFVPNISISVIFQSGGILIVIIFKMFAWRSIAGRMLSKFLKMKSNVIPSDRLWDLQLFYVCIFCENKIAASFTLFQRSWSLL